MKTLTFNDIANHIARTSVTSTSEAETFIKQFTTLIGNALRNDGNVTIDGIGTFRRIEISGTESVEFAPAAELAAAVNAPFAMFESIELDDDVTEEMLDAGNATLPETTAETQQAPTPESITNPEPMPEPTTIVVDAEPTETNEPEPIAQDEAIVVEPKLESEAASATESEPEPATKSEPAPTVEPNPLRPTIIAMPTPEVKPQPKPEPKPEPKSTPDKNERQPKPQSKSVILLAALVGLLIGLLLGWSAHYRILSDVKSVNINASDVNVYNQPLTDSIVGNVADTDENENSPAEPQPAPSPAVTSTPTSQTGAAAKPTTVTDTVRPGRFLTTIARTHYGDKCFWVYIYKENADKLGNPDLVESGTTVVIPPAEKYGINASDPASRAAANRLAYEILSKYE